MGRKMSKKMSYNDGYIWLDPKSGGIDGMRKHGMPKMCVFKNQPVFKKFSSEQYYFPHNFYSESVSKLHLENYKSLGINLKTFVSLHFYKNGSSIKLNV